MLLRLRRSVLYSLFLSGLLGLNSCGSKAPEEMRVEPQTFEVDHSEAIGFYTNGFLLGAVELPSSSSAHLKIFQPRDRAWGTKTLINTILSAANSLRQTFPNGERVQIGDLSAERGGTLGFHYSHQNGLDADIAYLRKNHVERSPEAWSGYGELFVRNGKLTTNFDLKRNWFLLREIVAHGNISQIFVDPEIKRIFCALSIKLDPSAGPKIRSETLRKLWPFPRHADHFHVRIKCPPTNSNCAPQEEPPIGTGCNRIDVTSFYEAE